MNIAPYWARVWVDASGDPNPQGQFAVFGWSFSSQAEAEAHGYERAKTLYKNKEMRANNPTNWYYPTQRPLREPILKSVGDENEPLALITRNHYGAVILNTRRVMFVDADHLQPLRPPDTRSWWQRLTCQPRPTAPPPNKGLALAKLRSAVEHDSTLGMRIYETANGYRGLVTSRLFTPSSGESMELLEACCNDPIYILLCTTQDCYRARLTPKPWRVPYMPPCNADLVYPYRNVERLNSWVSTYDKARAQYSVCRFVEHLGNPEVVSEAQQVVDLHDEWCVTGHKLA